MSVLFIPFCASKKAESLSLWRNVSMKEWYNRIGKAICHSDRGHMSDIAHPDRGQAPVRNTAGQTWFQRRIALFFDIVKNRSKFSKYGYCSMEKFLFSAIWAHFFKKEVKL